MQLDLDGVPFRVTVEFIRTVGDLSAEHCAELCCFNQQSGCPLDLGNEQCTHENGHWRVVSVDRA